MLNAHLASFRLISYIHPAQNKQLVDSLQEKQATVIGKCHLLQLHE